MFSKWVDGRPTEGRLYTLFETLMHWTVGAALCGRPSIIANDISVRMKKEMLFKIICNKRPVNQFPKSVHIVRTAISVVNVVRVLPNIAS